MSDNTNDIYYKNIVITERIVFFVCLFIVLIFIFIFILNFLYLYKPINNLNDKVINITTRIDSTLDKINEKTENVDIDNIVEKSLNSIVSNLESIIKNDTDNICDNYVPLTPVSDSTNQFLNSILDQACNARLNK